MFKMLEENRIVWVVFIVEDYFVIVVEVESLRLVCQYGWVFLVFIVIFLIYFYMIEIMSVFQSFFL